MVVSHLLSDPIRAPIAGWTGGALESNRSTGRGCKTTQTYTKKCLTRGRGREAPKKFSFCESRNSLAPKKVESFFLFGGGGLLPGVPPEETKTFPPSSDHTRRGEIRVLRCPR